MSPTNCSSSGRDAFTRSAPVLHSIRALTQRSVDRATTSSTTEATHSAEATENVIRFHSDGILWPHGGLEKATRRRAAIATPPWPSTWVYSRVRKKQKQERRMQFLLLICSIASKQERLRGGETKSMAVKEISYRGETLSLCVLHCSCRCHPLCTQDVSVGHDSSEACILIGEANCKTTRACLIC